MIKLCDTIVKTEVLIVGGGVAGLQASIAAAENGAKVLVVEKANTLRSGAGAMGNDHFMCYIPHIHGDDIDLVMKEIGQTMEGFGNDWNLMRNMMQRSFELVQKWESYGITMRPTGEYVFEGHSIPGNQRYHLKFDGKNQKNALTNAAKKSGVEIMNKVMINEILQDDEGNVVGALGIRISGVEPEVIIFQAKVVMLATGETTRLYPGVNPAYLFNVNGCPANTGAFIMGYRLGAKIVNADLPYVHCGPKFFARSGKGTWIGVISDVKGKAVGPFIGKPSRELGDPTAEIWTSVFKDRLKDGTGPTYMNCTEVSDEDLEHMKRAFVSEGISGLTGFMEQYGIDLRKDMIEFGTYEYQLYFRGLEVDQCSMTNVKGLFAAGSLCGNLRGSVTNAAVMGQIAGENMAKMAKELKERTITHSHSVIQEKIKLYSQFLERRNGAVWKEVNATLQQIMNDYVGMNVRSETMFYAAYKYVTDLQRYAQEQLKAENSHELMRCLEVLDLLELAKVVILVSNNRKESRPPCHLRTDYTYTNPLLNDKFQTIWKDTNGIHMEFRKQIL